STATLRSAAARRDRGPLDLLFDFCHSTIVGCRLGGRGNPTRRLTVRRSWVLGVALWGLALGRAGQAVVGDNAPEVIVRRAVQAAGGEARLAGLEMLTLKMTASIKDGDVETRFEGTGSFSHLDRFLADGKAEGSAARLVMSPRGCWRLLD